MIIEDTQNQETTMELMNRLPADQSASVFTRKDYVFPIDIPPEVRGWILNLIPKENPKSVVIRKTHKDFQTNNTTVDKTLMKLPPNSEILSCWMTVTTAFAGTGITAYTLSIGKDTAETALQTAQSVASTGLKLAVGTDFTTNRAIYSTTASTTIEARATATSANLDQSTAGEVLIYILYYSYPPNG